MPHGDLLHIKLSHCHATDIDMSNALCCEASSGPSCQQ